MGFFNRLFRKNEKISLSETNTDIRLNQLNHRKGNVSAQKIDITPDKLDWVKKRYIAFDVETTGLSAQMDRIVELGAVIFENGRIVDQYSTLVNPGRNIPEEASRVNHITNNMLSVAPLEEQVYSEFVEFFQEVLRGKIVVCAHNASFDMSFLTETLRRLGFDGNIYYIDTLSLSRKYLKLDKD